jgi:hypothetical protein
VYIEQSDMRNSANKQTAKMTTPFCQATGCFDHAEVYVVVKETEEAFGYDEISRESDYQKTERDSAADTDFDGFKLILYLCSRHHNDFHYLLNGSELHITKRAYLGSNGFHASSR